MSDSVLPTGIIASCKGVTAKNPQIMAVAPVYLTTTAALFTGNLLAKRIKNRPKLNVRKNMPTDAHGRAELGAPFIATGLNRLLR